MLLLLLVLLLVLVLVLVLVLLLLLLLTTVLSLTCFTQHYPHSAICSLLSACFFRSFRGFRRYLSLSVLRLTLSHH